MIARHCLTCAAAVAMLLLPRSAIAQQANPVQQSAVLQTRAAALSDLLSETRWVILAHRARLQAEEARLVQEQAALRGHQPANQTDQLRAEAERLRQEAAAARAREAAMQPQIRNARSDIERQLTRFQSPALPTPESRPATQPLRGMIHIQSARNLNIGGREIILAGVVDFQNPPIGRINQLIQAIGNNVDCAEVVINSNVFVCRAQNRDLAQIFVLNGLAMPIYGSRPDLRAAEETARQNGHGCWGQIRC